MFNNIIKILKCKKKKDPMFYNNNNTKYLMKDEFNISNNVVKEIKMLNINEKYIVGIYDNGTQYIVNDLLDLEWMEQNSLFLFERNKIFKHNKRFIEFAASRSLFCWLGGFLWNIY